MIRLGLQSLTRMTQLWRLVAPIAFANNGRNLSKTRQFQLGGCEVRGVKLRPGIRGSSCEGAAVTADDAALVRRCLSGKPAAMRELSGRFQADVFGLSLRSLTHRQDAEDVTQETFLRVFRSLRRWDSKRPLRPWILGIAVNRCRTWLGRRVKRPELADYLHETAARDDT